MLLVFRCNYVHCDTPNVFIDYTMRNNDIHHNETRGSADFNVTYGRLDIQQFSLKVWDKIIGHIASSLRKPVLWRLLSQSLRMICLVTILGIGHVLFPNTMLVFSLLKHD